MRSQISESDRIALALPFPACRDNPTIANMGRSSKTGSSSPVSLVVPGIYLGPASAASSKDLLAAHSVTHVLSVGASPAKPVAGTQYARISISDSPSSSILNVCDSACHIIDAALASAGTILMHCSTGISRSPMVVAAYLMRRRDMSLKTALRQIVVVRPYALRGEVSLIDVDEFPKREKDRLALLS